MEKFLDYLMAGLFGIAAIFLFVIAFMGAYHQFIMAIISLIASIVIFKSNNEEYGKSN